ncbi:MAG TPA: L,D-transpeptidase family protein [Bacteroidia bacterium]|nr:L,D-transpeptidase family protein [Bacteroidia bacterium]
MKTLLLVPITAMLILSACGGNDKPGKENQVVAEDPEKVNKLLVDFISDKLANADTSAAFHLDKDSLPAISFVKQVYAKNQFRAFWTDKGKLNTEGNSLFSVIKDAESFGLIPDNYHFSAIDTLIRTSYDSLRQRFNINKLAHADLMMTDAFFQFAVHVSVGRMDNDSAIARSWRIAKLDTDMIALFETALAKKDFGKSFESLEPQRREYQAIKKYMNEFRKKYAGVVWQHLPDRKTDSAGFFAGVKTRLIETGDYDSTSPDKDSLRIATALKKFQRRYFLEEDGKIGRNTILALDMLPEDWVTQMAMNLERWRWEPEKFEKRHMIVNLAAFKMTVWETDSIFMESKIVCGAVKTQTPELDSKINQITLYPYWNVPYSISWKEILPHVQRDTSYLRKEHMQVLNSHNEVIDYTKIKWKHYSRGNLPFKFRQMTGDENALGIMKFEFNNKYSVYMHDTNAKKYFKFTTRAFSHGCMRLEKYMDLAHFLIRDDSVKLPRDTFDRWTTLDSNMKVLLRKPLPIHVRYFTCDVDTDGNVFVHTDIYLRDRRMMKVIYRLPADPDAPKPSLPENTTKVQEQRKVMIRRKDENVGIV